MTISLDQATETLMSAAYFANDNADPCSILKCEDKKTDSFVVVMHKGIWNHDHPDTQRFLVTVTAIPTGGESI
jgi:hypothetical protein